MVAVAMMTAMGVRAQRLQVCDSEGNGIPLVCVLTEDGTYIGSTDMNGVMNDVEGAAKVALTHVAYKPQLVTVAELPPSGGIEGGRCVTMEDLDYGLDEVEIKPKTYIYVETFYRVYVYRDDSLCYFLSGIMPNAYNPQKKKLEHGSYYHAYAEYCSKKGAAITWGARAQRFKAGLIPTGRFVNQKKYLMDKYFVTTDDSNPNCWVFSNPEGRFGQFVRSGGMAKLTLDGGRIQMYANKARGETKKLERRQEIGYEYQYTRVYADNEDGEFDRTNFMMESNHWEYNDKKSHVKFIIETYATDHDYMDKDEWQAKKKEIKTNYKTSMTIDQFAPYEQQHNIPALSSAVRQAIGKLYHIL